MNSNSRYRMSGYKASITTRTGFFCDFTRFLSRSMEHLNSGYLFLRRLLRLIGLNRGRRILHPLLRDFLPLARFFVFFDLPFSSASSLSRARCAVRPRWPQA